jgi:hydroxymethylglutaryl-CoA synthase
MSQHMGEDWVHKCERNLYLAKNLGNIYTGSLYNGLLSLLLRGLPKEEGGEGIDLKGKRVCMFSYGSGCASSMFLLRINSNYETVFRPANFKQRLESRVKISPEVFDRWMQSREDNYGKCPYVP